MGDAIEQSISWTTWYNAENEMSCSAFKAVRINPPMAPFLKGGGPQNRGILALNAIIESLTIQEMIHGANHWK